MSAKPLSLVREQTEKTHRRETYANSLRTEGDGLRGLACIAAYSQYGEKALRELIDHEGFPAIYVYGAWESSKILIDEWRRERIRLKLCQAVSDPQ